MNRLLLCFIGTLSVALTACDYNDTPGKNTQFDQNFTNAPKATAAQTDLDSLSQSQDAYTPIGKGSAADQQSSTKAAIDAQPGASPTSPMPQAPPQSQTTSRD